MVSKVDYVRHSAYRARVVRSLGKSPNMPSRIAQETGIRMNHVSITLAKLSDQGLVECINPEVRKGRLYRLTAEGERVAKKLED